MVEFRVQLFAGAREAVDTDYVCVVGEAPLTAGRLMVAMGEQNPKLQPWVKVSRLAVNDCYVADDQATCPEDQLALIPPVSGG